MSQWQDQVAVITGAASGIGSGLARHCASVGMQVVGADVDQAGLDALQSELGSQFKALRVDVREYQQLDALAATVFSNYGQVNLLFNNAGVLVDGKSWEREIKDWQWIIDVNIMGVINGIKAFVPRMLKQNQPGRIINTSSIGGLMGGAAFMAPYQGSKHMITAITESLYQELRMESAPITASVLCPSEVATGIWNSDRLRSEDQHNTLHSEAEQQLHDLVAGGVAAGLSPEEMASRAFVQIEEGKFWILPQREFIDSFNNRQQSVVEQSQPLSMAELMGLDQ